MTPERTVGGLALRPSGSRLMGTKPLATLLAAASLGLLAVLPSTSKGGFPGHTGRIAFICSGGDRTESDEVCVADPDGAHLGYITWSYNQFERTPRWSADGRRLAFIADSDGPLGNVAVINADRSGLHVLTHDQIDSSPAWSPDGSRIVFGRATEYVAGKRTGSGELVSIGADGTGERVLRVNHFGIAQPAWSPDGRTIAYWSNHYERREAGIYEMDADGSNERRLIPDGAASQPTWSPDGLKLAYVYYSDIWVANADGSNPRNVTRTDYDTTGIAETEPAWSPDGNQLAFSRVAPAGTGREYYVYTISVDGTGLRRLATTNPIGLPWTSQPDWQPCPAACPPAPGLQVQPPSNQRTVFLTVGPGKRISVTDSHGRKLKRVSAFRDIAFVLRDRSRRDNVHLRGGNLNLHTGIRFVGKRTLPPQRLRLGRYDVYSDAHHRLRTHFSVVG